MLVRRLVRLLLIGLAAIAPDPDRRTTVASAADPATLWSSKVQPLFDTHCVKCHGPIEQQGGLELDTAAAVIAGGTGGVVVVAGRPEASPLYRNLGAEGDPHMPPDRQLTDQQRALVREWIEALGEAPSSPAGATAAGYPGPFATVTDAIDLLMAEGWSRRGIDPAAAVDDAIWCRRVWLDLAGRIPTAAEAAEFLACPAATRREALVDRLLDSDEHAVRMRELWDAILMGRARRESREDRRRDSGWWSFLERGFRSNRPWDAIVRDLLVARPADAADRGASWFLYERRNDHQAIAEAVAPIVYGVRIDCAQCHDHPLAREIRQGHYWGLVAAFNRGKNVEGSTDVAESAVGGFVNFTNLRKESQPAVVTLLGGATIGETRPEDGRQEEDGDDRYVDPAATPRVPKFSRREAFAAAATVGNPLLARAFVNRTWASLLGRGLVAPVDEMSARNVPSHPDLLDWLAADFASHGHDIRRLVRGIVLSRVYGLGRGDQTSEGIDPATFAFQLDRALPAETLARSWCIAAGRPPGDEALRRAAVAALPDVMPREYQATFQQARFLSSSPRLRELLEPVPGSSTAGIVALPTTGERVVAAFEAAFGRPPDVEEAAVAARLIDAAPDRAEEACRDLLWALLVSPEFLSMP